MRILQVLILFIIANCGIATAADLTDHPLLSAYQGSDLRSKDVKEFDEYKAFTGLNEEGEPTGPVLEGKVTRLNYKNPPDRSILEMFRNYEQALNNAGAEILHQCNQKEYECAERYAQSVLNGYNKTSAISNTAGRYIIGKVTNEENTAYISVAVGASFTQIHVIEIKNIDTGMVTINAAVLGEGIDKDGYVIVEGIYFDTDKTTLKPESKPALDEVAKLLKERTDLVLYVVGHTDMQGSLAHNMTLSKGRAQAVVSSLTTDYSISADRLEGHGVGPLAPQSTNLNDTGRAKNRRVVLVAR